MPSTKQKVLPDRLHIRSSSKLCVSVCGHSVTDLKARIASAREFSPAFLELRLDYLTNPNPLAIAKLSEVLEGNEIFTFRSNAEGGVSKLSEERRIALLRRIISVSKPPFVDIELATLTSSPELAEKARAVGSKLIASSHDFHSMEEIDELRSLVTRSSRQGEFYAIKVVRTARNFTDNKILLSLYEIGGHISPARLIAFCAGPFGILSRIACVSLGSPFAYVSLPNEKTAPGQLDARTMQSLLQNW